MGDDNQFLDIKPNADNKKYNASSKNRVSKYIVRALGALFVFNTFCESNCDYSGTYSVGHSDWWFKLGLE